MTKMGFTTTFAVVTSLVFVILPLAVRGWAPGSRPSVDFVLHASKSSISLESGKKGKLLVLGGTGFLGQAVCNRANVEGYDVVSLSRRGLPPPRRKQDVNVADSKISYMKGDARNKDDITTVMNQGNFVGVIHCVGLLFDSDSGLARFNRFVSGSGSLPDADSSYESITRVTAFNAIEAALEYAQEAQLTAPLPFCFASAAEAGWTEVTGGKLLERVLPEFAKRYLVAKRAVEKKLMESDPSTLRPVIVRPSLVYSIDRPASLPAVSAFFVGNKVGLPFIDRPVAVQPLANAMVRSIGREHVRGVLRYPEINALNQ